ncbi:MAG: beta-N-acetylhexosaminidase [Spirochaetaceae bacterium]|jgi:beta-N-acetylhexosaminidase|nr:beta-N-acetylhexosaminidase [Spirochaetaceae bacterium]
MNVCGMTVKQKIGQRFAIGFSGTKASAELCRLVREYKVGNVILFGDNLESASQARALCRDIQELVRGETGYPAFIAIDQEGGSVTRLPPDMVNVPGAMALASTGKPDNVFLAAQITAAELRRIGVNLNLAPVLDINCNKDNPVIGNRSYATAAERVVPFAAAAIRAYEEAGLMCCGKHFPGHGDTAVDSHLALPLVNRKQEELDARELVPFRAAVAAGIPAIMTTHILFPQLENERLPATMSGKILKGLLREKLGFDGLILSDGMEMKAVKDFYGIPKGCALALSAGVDIVFICHESPDMEASLREINTACEKDSFDAGEFDDSVERILWYKEQYAAFGLDAEEETVEDISRRKEQNAALMQIALASRENGKAPPPLSERPFFAGSLACRPTLASSSQDSLSFAQWFAKKFGGSFHETPVNPNTDEIARIVSTLPEASSVVLGTCNGHLNRGQIDLAYALFEAAQMRKIPFACLALQNPWDLSLLPPQAYGMALWEYSLKSFQAAAAVFRGECTPCGRFPEVKIISLNRLE